MNTTLLTGYLYQIMTFQPATPPADGKAPAAPATPPEPEGPSAMENFVSDPTAAVSAWSKKGWTLFETYGPRILGALILLILAFMVAAWARRFMLKALTRAKIDITLAKFLANVTRWAIIIFALITSAGTLGIDTTGFAAAIAAAGLAIGLALQGNLGNLASGVLLMIFRPFKIGDAVIVAGQSGIVDGIDLFTTNLDTGDNRRIIVPNGAIFSGVIENQTRHPQRQIVVNIPISGAIELERAQALLLAAAQRASNAPGALREPAPAANLAEITPVTWAVSLWAHTSSFATVRQALLRELKATIDHEQLAPPPPTTNINMRSLPVT